MDIMPIANLATAMAQSQTVMDAQIALLKTAMEQTSADALTLLEAIPTAAESVGAASAISTLGANIDVCV